MKNPPVSAGDNNNNHKIKSCAGQVEDLQTDVSAHFWAYLLYLSSGSFHHLRFLTWVGKYNFY